MDSLICIVIIIWILLGGFKGWDDDEPSAPKRHKRR
jgi:hypothetical protein